MGKPITSVNLSGVTGNVYANKALTSVYTNASQTNQLSYYVTTGDVQITYPNYTTSGAGGVQSTIYVNDSSSNFTASTNKYGFVTLTNTISGQVISFQLGKPAKGGMVGVNVAYVDGDLAYTATNKGGAVKYHVTEGGNLNTATSSSDNSNWGTHSVALNNKQLNQATLGAGGKGTLNTAENSSGITNWDGAVAETYKLTTGADSIAGAAGNDIINGTLTDFGLQTFQSWDTIDGGTGTNVLNVQTQNNQVLTPTLSNIQTLNMQDATIGAGASAVTLNLNGLSSLTNVTLDGNGQSAFTLTALGSVPASVSINGTSGANALSFTSSALGLLGQNLALNLSNVTGGNGLTLSAVSGTNALETISITSGGSIANNLGALTTSGLGTTLLKVQGSQGLTFAVTDANSTLKTIDASLSTGTNAITGVANSTVTGGAGNDTITSGGGSLNSFTGGLGNDTFTFAANPLSVNTTVAGGLGSDTLSAASASLGAFTAAAPTTNISGIEAVTASTILGGATFTLSAIQAGIATVNLRGAGADTGTITFDSGVVGAVNLGSSTVAETIAAGNLTVTTDGSATNDAVTVSNKTVGTDIFNAGTGGIIATGVETLTVDGTTSSTTTAFNATPTVITMTPSFGGNTALILKGNNSFVPTGIITANSIDASALANNATGTATALTMAAVANTATTIIGSAGADTLRGNGTLADSITGGAGNDTITGGTANDVLLGQDGDDTLTVGTGTDSVDGGAGNDVVSAASGDISASDTVSGGTGTADVLSYTTFVAGTDNVVANQVNVSNFEILRMAGAAGAGVAVSLQNYINDATFTSIQLGTQAATGNGYAFAGASANLNTIDVIAATSGTDSFARLVDTTTDSLTVRNANPAAGGGALTLTQLTANDEETITITESVASGTAAGSNDLTIGTLIAGDLTTLNITGAEDVTVTTLTAALVNTVNASTATGAVSVNATGSGASVTMTGNANSSAAVTFTGAALGDNITGGGGADALSGAAGADTINGGAGADTITGGTGADSVTGGAGVDSFRVAVGDGVATTASSFAAATLAAGDTLTFGNGVDVISGFVAGAGGDVLDNTTTNTTTLTSGIGLATANGFVTTTTAYYISGYYNSTTHVFTAAANGAGTDTAIVEGVAATALNASTTTVVLVGVNSADLTTANFA